MPSLVQCAASKKRVERETGFEPATPSLEGWRSTAELFPPGTMVGRGGFEPPKAYASRFTVCPLWPLGYLPERGGLTMRNLSSPESVLEAGAGGRNRTPDPLLTRQLLFP